MKRFLLREHMLCASGKTGFMFRVGKAQHFRALARRHAGGDGRPGIRGIRPGRSRRLRCAGI